MKNQNSSSVTQIVSAVYLAAFTWLVVEAARALRAQRKKGEAESKAETKTDKKADAA